VRIGDLDRPHRNVVARPLEDQPGTHARERAESAYLRLAQASALTCPRATVSHVAAAIAYRVPTIGQLGKPCLTVPSGTALRDLAHIHLHRATLPDDGVVLLGDLRVTTPARTVMDIARERGVAAGVVAADYVLHTGLANASELAAAFEVSSCWPGRKAARTTLAFADGAAESPLESLSRLRIAAFGLPAPRPQAVLCDEFGRFIGRGDFYWDEFGVVGESDGDLKYDDDPEAAIVKERRRERGFCDTGLITVRWGWSDLYEFDKVVKRLQAANARGFRPGSPDRRWTVRRDPGLHL
jgi:hypothetical protein